MKTRRYFMATWHLGQLQSNCQDDESAARRARRPMKTEVYLITPFTRERIVEWSCLIRHGKSSTETFIWVLALWMARVVPGTEQCFKNTIKVNDCGVSHVWSPASCNMITICHCDVMKLLSYGDDDDSNDKVDDNDGILWSPVCHLFTGRDVSDSPYADWVVKPLADPRVHLITMMMILMIKWLWW